MWEEERRVQRCTVRHDVITTSGSLLSSPSDVSTTNDGLPPVLPLAAAALSSFCLSLVLVLVLLLLLSFACAFTALASVQSVVMGRGKPICATAAADAPPLLGVVGAEGWTGFCPGCRGVLVVLVAAIVEVFAEGARARAEVLMGWVSPKRSLM